MYNDYLRSLLPIPILDIKISKNNNYRYKIVTYRQVADESRMAVANRVKKCKRIKSIDGWYLDNNIDYKYAIIDFNKNLC